MNQLVVKNTSDFANIAVLDQYIKKETFKDDIRPYLANLAVANPQLEPLHFIEFIQSCALTGADPRRKQAYLIPYKKCVKGTKDDVTGQWSQDRWITVASTVFAYQFFIAKAQEMGDYEGYEVKSFKGKYFNPYTGNEVITLFSDCTVKRKGRAPFTYRAWLPEFVKSDRNGNPTEAWQKPYLMLEKCSVACAFRNTWPESMSGMYISEEMQSENLADAAKAAEKIHAQVSKATQVDVETTARPFAEDNSDFMFSGKKIEPVAAHGLTPGDPVIEGGGEVIGTMEVTAVHTTTMSVDDEPLDNVPETQPAPMAPAPEPAKQAPPSAAAEPLASQRTKALLWRAIDWCSKNKGLKLKESLDKTFGNPEVGMISLTESRANVLLEELRLFNFNNFVT